MIMRTNLIAELDNLFFLLTILVRVKVFRPVVITSGLNREEEEYFANNYRWLPKEESTAYEEQQRHDDDSSSQLKSFATISQESFL